MPLSKLREVMQRGSPFMSACYTLRDTVAFHADHEPLLEWLDDQPDDRAICLFSQSAGYVQNIVSDGPLEMVEQAAQRMLDVSEFGGTLAHVVGALPRVLEAMCAGFVVKFGLRTSLGVVQGHRVVHFFDPAVPDHAEGV